MQTLDWLWTWILSSSPVCRCVWQRRGWCEGFWSPWRCPAGERQRRSCCSGRGWTWWCTTPGTGRTGTRKDSDTVRRWCTRTPPLHLSSRQPRSSVKTLHSSQTYIVGKHHSQFPDVVLGVDWAQPGEERKKKYDHTAVRCLTCVRFQPPSVRCLSHHDTSDASLVTVSSVGLKSRALLSSPSSSAILSAPYKSPYFLITYTMAANQRRLEDAAAAAADVS